MPPKSDITHQENHGTKSFATWLTDLKLQRVVSTKNVASGLYGWKNIERAAN